MKKVVLIVLTMLMNLSAFAWFSFQKDVVYAVKIALQEGCSAAIEESKNIETKYGTMKTADNSYIVYYPSGKIRFLFLQDAVKVKIKDKSVTINSFQEKDPKTGSNQDFPVEFYENGNLKKFICEDSLKIKKLHCKTRKNCVIVLDDAENVISFVPEKTLNITYNNYRLRMTEYFSVELYSNGNIKSTLAEKTKIEAGNMKTDLSNASPGSRFFVDFYDSGEIEKLEVSRTNLGHEGSFSILLNDEQMPVSGISFYKNGICKEVDFNPAVKSKFEYNGEKQDFVEKCIFYKPDGKISAVTGTLGSKDYFWDHKSYLIYSDGIFSRLIKAVEKEDELEDMFFDEENTPVYYLTKNKITHVEVKHLMSEEN